jgi:LacI family transcriptional regulator
VSDLANPFYSQLLAPLHDALDRAGYRMVVFAETGESTSGLDRLIDRSVDGIILAATLIGSPWPYELSRRGVPFVFLNREIEGVAADSCVVDNELGARLVAELFLAHGHRRIGAIFGPDRTSTSRVREAAFRARLADSGVVLRETLVRRGWFTYEVGREGMLELLGLSKPPTAVFCANDVLALGALNAAAARSVAVPADLTIVGFDDIAMAAWDVFGLTTVRHDFEQMVRTTVDALLGRIVDPDRAVNRVLIRPELVLRRTHGPPRSPHRRPVTSRSAHRRTSTAGG